MTGKPKKRAKPKAEEPEDEGVEQYDVVEALLSESAQLTEEIDTLQQAARQAPCAVAAAECRAVRRERMTAPQMTGWMQIVGGGSWLS